MHVASISVNWLH